MAKLIQELFRPKKKINTSRTISLRLLHTKASFSKTVAVKGKDRHTQKLVFQPSWLEKYTWLVYNPLQMKGFCKYCVMHNNPSNPRAQKRSLVTAPFQKLEKATGKDGVLECHQKMQSPVGTRIRHCHNPKCSKTKGNLAIQDFQAKPRDVSN